MIFTVILVALILMHVVPCKCKNQSENIKTLLRQSARWAIAAENDNNSMIATLHANYAAGYLWALNDIATDCEIEEITGVNYLDFKNKITSVQDAATINMSKKCPQWAPPSTMLSRIAGESV